MKPMMSLVVLAMIMSFLGEACAQIRLQRPKLSPPLNNLAPTNLNPGTTNQPQGKLFKPLSPMPETPLPEAPSPEIPRIQIPEQNFPPGWSDSGRLPPGVYQTKPYAGIIIAPGPEHDDCSVLGPGNIYPSPRMPVIHPHIEVIPKPPVKP